MNIKLLATLLTLGCVACNGDNQSDGPDWGDTPLPEKPSSDKVQLIEPTTAIAPEGSDYSKLQYYPGMQINVADNTFSSRLAEVAAAGFKYVELKIKHSYGIHNKNNVDVAATFASMQRQMEEKGIIVWSIHLPYEDTNWTNISSSNQAIRQRSVEHTLRVLRLCVENFPTCKNYVIHASKGVSSNATAIEQAHKSLAEMVPVANQYGVRFCVENLVGSFCYTKEDHMAVINYSDDVYATFDIGHANCKAYDVVNFLTTIGDKLGTVHIHDTVYGSGNDDHRLVGDGDIATKNRPWGEVYRTLLANNRYRGVFMFEPKDNQSAADVMATYQEILKSYYAL